MKFNEEQLEKAIIALLEEQGYPHTPGGKLERDARTVLLTDDLKTFLAGRYPDITDGEIASVVRRLESLPSCDLYESNKTVTWRLSLGVGGLSLGVGPSQPPDIPFITLFNNHF